MSLSFSRSDITQTAQAERGTMCVLPLGKGKRQNKLALGDVDGVVRVVGCKRDERNVVFKLECGNGAPITSLSCGVAAPQVDKLFASAGNTIRGINRKGKEFFKFTTNLQDVIKALHVDNYNIYAASEYVANMYVNCADSHFFMSNDRILDVVIAPVILPDEKNPILACADRFIRVVQGSDLYYEAAVNGVPTTLCRCVENEKKRTAMNAAGPAPGTDAKAGKIEILFGTEQGSVGQLFLDGNAVTRGWVIDAARGVGGVSALYGDMDCTGDGNCDVVVGRDDGGLEVYALDTNGQPALVYQKSLGEAVQTIRHGCVSSPFPEILVHTFSGKVLGFAPGSDSRTIDGFGLGAEKTEHEERQDNMRAEKRVKQLNKELEKLAKEVEKAKENYAAVSGGLIAVDGPAKVLDRFVLDADDACYALSLEAPAALFSVSVHSDVPIDLLDVKDNAAICSRSPADPANGTHAAATYRVNEGNNRVELRMRAIEGRAGTVRSFVVPRQSPKTSTEKVHHIKPLCLHRRVNAMSSAAAGAGAGGEDEASTAAEEDAGAAAAAPVNELVARGDFTLDDAHHWCVVCLNEIPTRTPTGVEHATYEFENVLLKTTLKIVIGDGEMTCVSDNVSPLALLKDLIGKEATENQLRVNFSFNLSDASVAHFCDRAHPLIEYQRELVRKGELVEGLKELRTQENGDVDFLDDEYKRILADEAKIVAELKEQPRRLEYLHGVVKDFTVDWHKFRGSNVKRALAGIDEALALGDVSRERLEEIVSRGAA